MTTSSGRSPLPHHADDPGQAPVVRLRGPDDVARAVPHLLGFHPTESLVVLFLAGSGARLVLTARVDLPRRQQEPALARQLLARARHAGADRLVVSVHTSARGGPGSLPRAGLVRAFTSAGAGPRTVEALLVRDGRWWSYLAPGPTAGTEVAASPGVDHLAAEQAFSGRAVLHDRAALVASLAPPAPDPRLARRYLRAEAALRARWRSAEGRAEAAEEAVQAVLALAAHPAEGPGPDDDLVLAAAVGVGDLHARDRAIAALPEDQEVLGALVRAARRCPRPFDAGLCGLLAWRAYLDGDGAVARVALERALASDPAHGLARLLDDALDRQVPPSVLADVLAAVGSELS